jgi:hypothetical protein
LVRGPFITAPNRYIFDPRNRPENIVETCRSTVPGPS